jgi:hypothetical protein
VFATWHQIPFAGLATADERHEVVHRQLFGRKAYAAVMANPYGELTFPPLARAQLPRFSALAADLLVGYLDQKRAGLHPRFLGTALDESTRMSGANELRSHTTLLFIPVFQLLEIDAEAESYDNVEKRAQGRPAIVGAQIVSIFPKGEKDKKEHRDGD